MHHIYQLWAFIFKYHFLRHIINAFRHNNFGIKGNINVLTIITCSPFY